MSLLRRQTTPRDDAGGATGASRFEASALLRLRVWLNAHDLDRRLADGCRPVGSAQLELRTLQLASARCRWSLAAALVSRVAESRRPIDPRSAITPLRRSAVLAAGDDLLCLAGALTHPGFNDVRGVALASCLLRDPQSPLYMGSYGSLLTATRSATAALQGL